MSWGLSEAPERFQRPRDALGGREASWDQGEQREQAGDFLRPQEGSRDPGMVLEQGEQAGGFLRPQEGSRDPGILWKQGELTSAHSSLLPLLPACSRDQGYSGSKGSKLGARGVSWGLPEAPERFQGPRDLV